MARDTNRERPNDPALVLAWGVLVVPYIHWVCRSPGSNVSETVLTKGNQRLVTVGLYRLLSAFVAAVLIRLVVVPVEERELVRRFGDPYREYTGRTGAGVC